ncbi:flagellar hook protein FlgE [Microvirga sp. CF3016]|uniref:flagellar hook protein FlgE n=1 Tax=Microvirga sp. CF3016 TaxID=3110181 RepID=UPI002E7618DE|nr:flagellar hook protein FlgE [Microvirga sp. CF3016]MEE1612576.1 flagellar hook protein FlgE [Microvirga sp. CF3016]
MSLYGVLRSGVSGMNAQSNKLGTVAENIQNSSTNGYKRASTEFSSLILPSSEGNYNSGSVTSRVRYTIADQGPIAYTTSASDLAISGNGFFVVSDPSGSPYLTRAGNFVKDGRTGNLVNAAGFTLMGYKLGAGAVNPSLNSLDGVEPVNMASFAMQASGSTKATFKGNLPDSTVAQIPPVVSQRSSLQVYDKVGNPIKVDIALSKINDTQWNITVSSASGALTGTTSMTLEFDADGKLNVPSATMPTSIMSFGIPGGETLALDMAGMTQLAGEYNVVGEANGNAPSAVKDVEFAADGTVYAVYEDGTRVGAYRIPLANVSSPDNLSPRAGNVYETTAASGGYQVGFPEMSGFGSIASGALEGSNVDIGTELTAMIEAQTSYTANSKVFQTGSELLDVLMNLKR